MGALDLRRVRLRPPRRRLRDRLVDAAAEEEPGHRRARPGQEWPPDRQPDRPAGDPQGAADRLQPGSPGGQGAAVRLGRAGRARRDGADRHDRHGDVRHRRDGRRRATKRRWRRPTWPSTWCAPGCRSGKRMPSSVRTSGPPLPARARSGISSRPTNGSVPMRRRWSVPASAFGCARLAVPPGRQRCPINSIATGRCSLVRRDALGVD